MAEAKKKVEISTPRLVEQVIGTAAADLKKAVESLNSHMQKVSEFEEAMEELTLKANNKATELRELEQRFIEEERRSNVQLKLYLEEKGLEGCITTLRPLGKEPVSSEELKALKEDLANLKANYKDDLQKAITIAVNHAKAEHEGEKKIRDAQHEQSQAENKFKILGQTDQINLLKQQLENITKQLDAEREAGIKRAQAIQAPNIHVGNNPR